MYMHTHAYLPNLMLKCSESIKSSIVYNQNMMGQICQQCQILLTKETLTQEYCIKCSRFVVIFTGLGFHKIAKIQLYIELILLNSMSSITFLSGSTNIIN